MALTQIVVNTHRWGPRTRYVFGTVSQTDLTRSLNPSLAQSSVIQIYKNISSYLQKRFLSFLRKLHKHLVSQTMRKWACTKSVLPACTGVTQSSNRGPERSRLRWLTRRVRVHSVVASAAIMKLLFPVKLIG